MALRGASLRKARPARRGVESRAESVFPRRFSVASLPLCGGRMRIYLITDPATINVFFMCLAPRELASSML
jgi:hypothetical protein